MTVLKRLLLVLLLCEGLSVTGQGLLVPPYLQPGNAPTLSKEQKVLIWHTDSIPGEFKVEFAAGESLSSSKISTAKINPVTLHLGGKTSILYRSSLTGLNFDAAYTYRISLAGKIISEATFMTRTKNPTTRFAVLGDCGTGFPQAKAIAYQMSQQKPQFILVTGDNVYSSGLLSEYHTRFFPVYLSPEASPENGASLMKTIPFYLVVGNHDVQATDLDKAPGGLAYFYFNDLPTNAPLTEFKVEATGKPETVKAFEKATGGRYPRLANYSFENGNVHITCLDANPYTNPLDATLVEWMRKDISSSKADWKFVAFHHPGFNSSNSHYNYQYMRLLAPLLEELGVDIVLNGHVHNYQRSVPLKFAPKKNPEGDHYIITPEGKVDGVFTLDEKFDGLTQTRANGIIYIVTGAGGAGLYDAAVSNKPDLWKHEPPENWAPFTVKLISDIHSFTVMETDGKKLTLRQLDAQGVVLDEIHVTK